MKNLLFILFFLILFNVGSAQYTIAGAGSSLAGPLIAEWSFAYSLLKPEVKIPYSPVGSGAGLRLFNDTSNDILFGGTDDPLPSNLAPNVRSFPGLASSVALVCNINLGTSLQLVPLNLTRNAVIGIFTGNITMWDDIQITSTNPGFNLPASPIVVVIRKDSSGTSKIFSSALDSFGWTYGSFNTWPTSLSNQSNWISSSTNIGVYATVFNTPNSIGYVVYSDVVENSVPTARIVKIQNRAGFFVGPDSSDGTQNQISFTASPTTFVNEFPPLVDLTGANTYPIVGFSYIYFRSPLDEDCARRREMLKFFRWILVDNSAKERATAKGYNPINPVIADHFLEMLEFQTCKQIPLLQLEYTPQHNTAIYPVLLALALILLVVVVIAHIWLTCRNLGRSTRPGLWFGILLAVGSLISYLSIIFWYITPEFSATCAIRQWLSCLGGIIMVGAVFAFSWTIATTIKNKSGSNTTYTVSTAALKSVVLFFIFFLAQLLILIFWSRLDPYSQSTVIINDIDRTAQFVCNSKNESVWLGLEAAIFGVLLFWGLYIVYSIWNLRRAVHETRWLLIAIYNLILVFAVFLPLAKTVRFPGDVDISLIPMIMIIFGTTSTMAAVMLPAIIRRFKLTRRLSSVKSNSSSAERPASHRGITTPVTQLDTFKVDFER